MRVDAARNRERLIAVAKARFAAGNTDVTFETIARASGVGIGTIYRHFPTRHALIEAVYAAELDALDTDADVLLERHPPLDAMRAWMDHYAAFVTTKHAMIDALRAALSAKSSGKLQTRIRVHAQIARFVAAGIANGTIRADVDPEVVSLAMAGMVLAAAMLEAPERLRALLDLVVNGLSSGLG